MNGKRTRLRDAWTGLRYTRAMPYISLQITPAAGREAKRQIVAEFTDTLVRVLGKKPEHIHIVIHEIEEENWGYAGLLTDEFRRRPETPPAGS